MWDGAVSVADSPCSPVGRDDDATTPRDGGEGVLIDREGFSDAHDVRCLLCN